MPLAERAAQPVAAAEARTAGKTVLIVSAVIAALVVAFVVRQVMLGGSISAQSLAMPVLGLAWCASLGLQALRFAALREAPATSERPSKRPPKWEPVSGQKPSPQGGPDRHASA